MLQIRNFSVNILSTNAWRALERERFWITLTETCAPLRSPNKDLVPDNEVIESTRKPRSEYEVTETPWVAN